MSAAEGTEGAAGQPDRRTEFLVRVAVALERAAEAQERQATALEQVVAALGQDARVPRGGETGEDGDEDVDVDDVLRRLEAGLPIE